MHATTLELELYVARRLSLPKAEAIEQHCDHCDACAASLATEAQLELTLRAVFAERRCGTAVDAGWEFPAVAPASTPDVAPEPAAGRSGMMLFAALAFAVLALVSTRLPSVHLASAAPHPTVATTDAGDFVPAAPAVEAESLGGDLSHGTP